MGGGKQKRSLLQRRVGATQKDGGRGKGWKKGEKTDVGHAKGEWGRGRVLKTPSSGNDGEKEGTYITNNRAEGSMAGMRGWGC